MDLQNIQDQLNTEFAKSETRIIFWFDDKDIDYLKFLTFLTPEEIMELEEKNN